MATYSFWLEKKTPAQYKSQGRHANQLPLPTTLVCQLQPVFHTFLVCIMCDTVGLYHTHLALAARQLCYGTACFYMSPPPGVLAHLVLYYPAVHHSDQHAGAALQCRPNNMPQVCYCCRSHVLHVGTWYLVTLYSVCIPCSCATLCAKCASPTPDSYCSGSLDVDPRLVIGYAELDMWKGLYSSKVN